MAVLVLFGCIGGPAQSGNADSQLPPQQPPSQEGAQPAGHGPLPIHAIEPRIPTGIENGLIKVPDPLSGHNPLFPLKARALPAPGESFPDPEFGTNLTRVTRTLGLRHEYSRFDPFNADKSMVLLQVPESGEWRVYGTRTLPYDDQPNLKASLSMEEPRWDPYYQEILWGLRDFKIAIYNVTDQTEFVVKDFSLDGVIGPIVRAEPDLYRITMNNEGESSLDKRYWAFILQGTGDDYRPRYIFTWDRQEDKVLGVYQISPSESSIDWVSMSSLGNYVLIGGDDTDRGNITGLMMANKELKRFHKLDYATAHSDVGLDTDGREILVMQNTRTDYIDMIPIDWNTESIDESGGSYEGTNRIPLIKLNYNSEDPEGLNSGVHISCNAPGYCVISTTIGPNVPEQNWLDRSMVLVRLDNDPETFYLAKMYGTTQDYWEETHAAISTDGRTVVWATNWNQHVGTENAKNMFEMKLELGG